MFSRTTLLRAVLAALFAALTCVATIAVQIPLPNGYLNLGDAVVLLSGWLLGPVYGTLAGGIGSMLADLFAFPQYAPATLVIKSLMALTAALFARAAAARSGKPAVGLRLIGGLTSEAIMVGGYLTYESMLYGFAGGMLSVPFNALQGGIGLLLAAVLYPLLTKLMKRL